MFKRTKLPLTRQRTLDVSHKSYLKGKLLWTCNTRGLNSAQARQAWGHSVIETTSFLIRNIFVTSYWNLLPTLLAQQIPLLLEHQGILPGQLSQAFPREFLLSLCPNKQKIKCFCLKQLTTRCFYNYCFKA